MNDQPLHITRKSNKPFTSKPKRSLVKTGAALALLVIAGLAYFFYPSDSATEKSLRLTENVTRGDIENTITAVGTLKALRSVNVGSQVSGQLKSVDVEVGDDVKRGQLIAEIDPASLEKRVEMSSAQLDNLNAQLLSKEAQREIKELNIKRQRTLLSSRGVSQAAVDQAEADLKIAEAEVNGLKAQIRQQEAQLDSEKVDLGYSKIYSPMDGTVVDQPAKEGETLNAVQTAPTIVTVADLSVMTVEAQVSEADISKLKIGMPVYFTLLGQPDKRYEGRLRTIKPKPEITNNVVLYYALFDVPNPDGNLMLDMSAQVYFVIDAASDALLVHTAALTPTKEHNKKLVTVIDKSGNEQERTITIGISNRVQTQVLDGLSEGDEVVLKQSTGDAASANRSRRSRGMF